MKFIHYAPVAAMSFVLQACGSIDPGAKASSVADVEPAVMSQSGRGSFVDGAASGHRIDVHEAVYAQGSFLGSMPGFMVLIGDATALCADMQNNSLPADSTLLGFGLIKPDGSEPSTDVYRVSGGDGHAVAVVQLQHLDGGCATDAPEGALLSAEDGAINVYSHLPSATIEGTFRLGFGAPDDLLEGQFVAQYCDAPNFLEQGGPRDPTCRH